jgi:hypothetical protein
MRAASAVLIAMFMRSNDHVSHFVPVPVRTPSPK